MDGRMCIPTISAIRTTIASLTALCLLFAPIVAESQPSAGNRRAVLVTGASSGIGRTIAEHLANRGYFVYAGARSAEDIAELSRLPNTQGVRLDVTVQADLDSAVAFVRRSGRGLHAVVNNAGIAALGPLVEMADRDMTALLDVNVMGPFRVTKAFAPLIIESRGRVVMISSISGVLSGAMLGGYSMSKHAVEAYGDALAAELARFGVGVSLVEPGNFRSEIGRTTTRQLERTIAANPNSPYIEQLRNLIPAMAGYDRYPEPVAVAQAVEHAISDSMPLRRYMVVPQAREGEVTIRKAVDELVQLNQWNAFRFDRDALVRMLDSSLARHPSRK
jgi:NAD(P)-dependent dehydrogenase (short-subunit alcohol dehydrogenase family)